MKPIPIETLETEDDILFYVIRVNTRSDDPYEPDEFVKSGCYCKVIMKIDNTITKTYYFKNGEQTSKEKIIQDERIKSLRR